MMVKRKTSRFENLFNLNRYKKRQGSKQVMQALEAVDIQALKANILPGDKPKMFQSYMIKDIQEHLAHLKTAFAGQSELLFYHAQLVVLIRREADTTTNYARFKALWLQETDFLLAHLNMRWLIAAVDTFIDQDDDAAFKSLMLGIVMTVNTIKLYETERHLLKVDDLGTDDYDAQRFAPAQKNCFNLLDELPSFRVGIDDTLRNMRWRMDEVAKSQPLAHQILTNFFDRINERGSVYTRFRAIHTKERNAWWSD